MAALIAQANHHCQRLVRLARQDFARQGAALDPFLGALRSLLAQLHGPAPTSEAERGALTAQLASAQDALLHLDVLLEAFSMQPQGRGAQAGPSAQSRT